MKRKTKIILWSILFLFVFVLSGILRVNYLGSAPMKLLDVEWNDSIGICYEDLEYENNFGHKYDLYIPTNIDADKEQSLILYIHGGSFNSGSKEDGDAWCKYYASKGYITATLDYSLQTVHENASLHVMNEEIENCVKSIYEKCADMGLNVTSMATAGVSAGGTLAMNYAYKCVDTSVIPVKFVFQLAAPADFEPSEWGILKKVNKLNTDAEFVQMMTGVKMSDEMIASGEYTQYIDEISTARLVNEQTPPTLCGYGMRDHLVPGELKYKLIDAFEKYSVTYDYIEFPNSNHGMYSDIDKLEEFLKKSLEYCKLYFGR